MKPVAMKIHCIIFLLFLAVLAGCDRPKKIDEKDLELIFRDIYLTNAFANMKAIPTDSIDIYSPVFEKYGYQPRDLTYTINDYAKRKSSRLADIVEAAIKQLETEGRVYERRVAILDTVELLAREKFRQVVYFDTLIEADRFADTAKLRLSFPAKEGSYKISYGYKIDTTDKNRNHPSAILVEEGNKRFTYTTTNWMYGNDHQHYEVKFDTKATSKTLKLNFGGFTKTSTRPGLRIDSLEIIYYLPVKTALDSIDRLIMDYKLLVDGKEFGRLPQDSSARRVHPPRIDPARGGDR